MPMPTRSLYMSDTPQNDEVVETNDSIPASDTGEQVQAESEVVQVDEVAEAKQKANDAFNKQYGEKKQLERDLKLEREKSGSSGREYSPNTRRF